MNYDDAATAAHRRATSSSVEGPLAPAPAGTEAGAVVTSPNGALGSSNGPSTNGAVASPNVAGPNGAMTSPNGVGPNGAVTSPNGVGPSGVVASPNGVDRRLAPSALPSNQAAAPIPSHLAAASEGAAGSPEMRDLHNPPTVTVIVPTRNEAPNVEPLVGRIGIAFAAKEHAPATTWEVIFVDDSDDETPGTVRKIGTEAPVRLLHRPPGARPEGLGGAVLEGFTLARGSVLVVMDADLQHPPELLPTLIKPILAGEADLVAGTRYVRAGAATGLAGPWRRAVSSGSRQLVHLVVRRSRCLSDPMSGLFALNREVVDGIELRPNGFKILLEVAARGRIRRVHNVAYRFAERNAGASKASLAEGVRFVRHLLGLMRASSELRKLPPIVSTEGDSSDDAEAPPLPAASDSAEHAAAG